MPKGTEHFKKIPFQFTEESMKYNRAKNRLTLH